MNAQAGPGPSTELHRKQQSASTSGLAQNGNGNDDDEDGDDTASKLKKRAYEDAFGDDDDDDRNEDPSDLPLSFYPPLSSAPHFLVPAQPTLLHPPTPGAGSGGDASRNVTRTTTTTTTVTPGFRINEKQIWQALKECVIEVNGDGGWGKVGSSLGGEFLPAAFESLGKKEKGVVRGGEFLFRAWNAATWTTGCNLWSRNVSSSGVFIRFGGSRLKLRALRSFGQQHAQSEKSLEIGVPGLKRFERVLDELFFERLATKKNGCLLTGIGHQMARAGL